MGGLLGETILDQYAETLGRVQQQGLVASVDEATRPYVRAFSKQYSRAPKSWTERLIGWFAERLGMSQSKPPPPPIPPVPKGD